MHEGTPLAPGDILIELTHGPSVPTLVTEAWYFKEGEGERWTRAKYGEFRVDSAGKALLVGMRGRDLDPL